MPLFNTPTPAYQGQGNQSPDRPSDWIDSIKRLFRTPTPQYLTRSVQATQAKNDARNRDR